MLALIAMVLIAPPPVARAATPAPAGGLALHGGMGASIDPRTGQLSASVPLTTSRGRGHAGVAMTLGWQQAMASAGVNRSGWGAGWSIGGSFVDTSGVRRVYPASGGAYFVDATAPSGLKNYKLADLRFATESGTLLRRPGTGPVAYTFTLSYDDGRKDFFDTSGNLAARVDRFGNRTDLLWAPRSNNVWRPTKVIDTYGLVTTFDYSVPDQVSVIPPTRVDGLVNKTVITLTAVQGVQKVTDAVGNLTTFGYRAVGTTQLIGSIVTPTGARTTATYSSPSYQPGLTVADTLSVADSAGTKLSPDQKFTLDPDNVTRHNFTGYPNHVGTSGQDALFESGDPNYTYSTSLQTGATTTTSTYDALHRLKKRTISVAPAGKQPVLAQTQLMDHPNEVKPPGSTGFPANYAKPTAIAVTASAATSTQGIRASSPRQTTTGTTYDDHGRVLSATDEVGTTTSTTYGANGLVTEQTTTGSDGSTAQMVNTLTDDGLHIATSTTSIGPSADTVSARQTTSYEYDDEHRLVRRTLAWAPGAEPDAHEPGGGPDQITTRFEHTVDVDLANNRGTETVTTTVGEGSDAASPSTATVDLASGLAMTRTDAAGRITTLSYDALGRRTKLITPGGLVTTTSYTPTQSTATSPDGRIIRTTTDLLGRTVSITDNVRNRTLGTDPGVRTIAAHRYSSDGSTMTSTDQAGRTTTSTVDAFSRPVSKVGPTGLRHLTAYDDGAAHTKTAAVIAEGATAPDVSASISSDNRGRPVNTQTNYASSDTGSGSQPPSFPAAPPTEASFDGLGQPTSSTSSDLQVETDRSGAGGLAKSSTATPQADGDLPGDFPGDPITAVTTHSLTGAVTSRTLEQDDRTSTAVAVDYDAAGQVRTATDPAGRETSYTYTADGQPLTKTEPSGAVTTYAYDATSGQPSGVTVTAPGQPSRTVSYTRVAAGQPGAGQVKTVSDGTDVITYGYDVDGHRTSVAYPDGTKTSAAYNDQGQLISTTDVTGAITTYVYDPTEGTLTSATQTRGTTELASVSYTYDAMDRIKTTTRDNGTVTTNTYTSANQLALQSTTDAGNRVLEAHAYTYDAHGNPATRTDTYPPGAVTAVPGGGLTWTTVYAYDAYDRLRRSDVYKGGLTTGQPSGLATTSTQYTVDVGGDVTATRTISRSLGIRPITTRVDVRNTIDPSGRLTSQQTGSVVRTQAFDDNGRVTTTLAGVKLAYTADGAMASVTRPDGSVTTYAYWPDGDRRSATTTAADGSVSSINYHYAVDGAVANDSTSDAGTTAGKANTASYLLTTGREARTLLPGTRPSGAVTGTPAAPIATGAGVGYYLRDRHNSMTGLIDAAGAVTGSYAYTDYGSAARADGRTINRGTAVGGRYNPYAYLGAGIRAPLTDAGSALLSFENRTYSPAEGRFLSPDPVDAHNRYQGFGANPIANTDLGGNFTVVDAVLDGLFAVIFAVTAVLTFGAAVAAVGAVVAATEIGIAVTGAAVANAIATSVGTVANLTAAAAYSALALDDDKKLIKHNDNDGFFNKDQRDLISLVGNAASAVAGATGAIQGITDLAGAAAFREAVHLARPLPAAAVAQPAVQPVVNADPAVVVPQVEPQVQVPVPAVVDQPAPNLAEPVVDLVEIPDVRPPAPVAEPEALQAVVDVRYAEVPAFEVMVEEVVPPPPVPPPPPPLVPDANPVVAQTLPGGPTLTVADASGLANNPAVTAGIEIVSVTENEIERPTVTDPEPVDTADATTRSNHSPEKPTTLPGTGQSNEKFTEANTQILLKEGST